MTPTRTDYEAVNRVGRVLRTFDTFDTFDLAHSWAKANARLHPGLRIDCVETTVVTNTVYRPRPRLVVDDLAVPEIPLRRAS